MVPNDSGSKTPRASVMMTYLEEYGFDGFDLDMESKHVYGSDKAGINAAVNLLASRLHAVNATLTRYAGCVHNGQPAYWNETCEEQVSGAPLVDRVAAAGPYWDNSVDGFRALVLDAINSTGTSYRDKLSIAFCPYGCASPINLTLSQLYDRFDMLCDLEIDDVYLFNIEALQNNDDNPMSLFYWDALRYFRTGVKVASDANLFAAAKDERQQPHPIAYGSGMSCWQSVFDPNLAHAAKSLAGTVGRYPGGTPSDYFDWTTGVASDTQAPFRKATPRAWNNFASQSGIEETIVVINQLTRNLSFAIQGLKAHEASGTPISKIELGNEMYDSSRADVMKAYPEPSDYGRKMATWIPALKSAFPGSQVALIDVRADADSAPQRELLWNKEVLGLFGEDADAATIHIYAGGMPSSKDTIPPPHAFAAFLDGALDYVERNAINLRATVPARMRVWITELGCSHLDRSMELGFKQCTLD